jgi:hypothetical protein
MDRANVVGRSPADSMSHHLHTETTLSPESPQSDPPHTSLQQVRYVSGRRETRASEPEARPGDSQRYPGAGD